MDYFDRVLEIMERATHLGVRLLENGTRLIGHVPHVAPEAWLHVVFPPLSARHVKQVEKDIGNTLPDSFASFLMRSNGLSLFSSRLSIDGLRWSYARSGDAAWQPFDIITPNILERPRHSKNSFIFIGGYGSDGSLLYIDNSTFKVYRCSNRSAKPLNDWPNFETMLEEEAKRLSLLFDERGHRIDPTQQTTPVLGLQGKRN
jgi:hypothetical protein